ncbi:MAG: tetratricopeptide (TPR) repeat protein [Planctomycetota bacterium]|jgi:tetratricopeptide (TPR) repeat protein
MLERLLSKGRVRNAARRLASSPSAPNYVLLAQAYVAAGRLPEVIKVCVEGLKLHAGSAELERLHNRAATLSREDRVRELQRELKHSPRPALWKELCDILLAAGLLARAEKVAEQWFDDCEDDEALFHRATVRSERYFADRRRDDARVALELLNAYTRKGRASEKALRLNLLIYSRCGAWVEARTLIARLLELSPGDPSLEARFRTVASMAENSKSLDQALREVERTGKFVDDELVTERRDSAPSIRPMLQEIAALPQVNGAFYVKGGTALVQGPRGASAERYARGVRELVSSTRGFARRLGLGQPLEILLEGDFGNLSIKPGSIGAAAVWSSGPPNAMVERALARLAGCESQTTETNA